MIFKRHMIPMLACCGAMLCGGCADDYFTGRNEVKSAPGEVTFRLNVSGTFPTQGVRSSLEPDDERTIDRENFRILLFASPTDADSWNSWTYKRTIRPASGDWSATGASGSQALRISLKPDERSGYLRAMFIAGLTDSEFDSTKLYSYGSPISGGFLCEDLYMDMPDPDADYWWPTGDGGSTKRKLPMYGHSATFDANSFSVPTIKLIRNLARIDVGVNLTSVGGMYDLDHMQGNRSAAGADFRITRVWIRGCQSNQEVIPLILRNVYNPSTGEVIAPSGQHPTYRQAPLKYDVPATLPGGGGYLSTRQIYVPDLLNNNTSHPLQLVVEGLYGTSTTPTFYPIEFYDRGAGSSGDPYNLIRNHAYIVNIKSVGGPGYPTLEQALRQKPINGTVAEIRVQDQSNMVNITTDGQYRLALSSQALEFNFPGQKRELQVYTDFISANPDGTRTSEDGWKLSFEGSKLPAGQPAVAPDAGREWVEFYDEDGNVLPLNRVLSGPGGVARKFQVAMKPYGHPGDRQVRLRYTAGRLSSSVLLSQHINGVPGSVDDWTDQDLGVDVVPVDFHISPARLDMNVSGISFSTKVSYNANYPVDFLGYFVDGKEVTPEQLPNWLKGGFTDMRFGVPTGNFSIQYTPTDEAEHPSVLLKFKCRNLTKEVLVNYANSVIPTSVLQAAFGWTPNGVGAGVRIYPSSNASRYVWGDYKSVSSTNANASKTGFNDGYWCNFALGQAYPSIAISQAPAYQFCNSLGGSYFLPSLDELDAILRFNNFLAPAYRFETGVRYWTGSEGNSMEAWTVTFQSTLVRNKTTADKSVGRGVRCIRYY